MPHKSPGGVRTMPKSWKLRNIAQCPICNVQKAVMGSVWFFCCGKRHELHLNKAKGEVKENVRAPIEENIDKISKQESSVLSPGGVNNIKDGLQGNASDNNDKGSSPGMNFEVTTNYKKVEETMVEKQEEAQCGECHSKFKYDESNPPSGCPHCGVEFE